MMGRHSKNRSYRSDSAKSSGKKHSCADTVPAVPGSPAKLPKKDGVYEVIVLGDSLGCRLLALILGSKGKRCLHIFRKETKTEFRRPTIGKLYGSYDLSVPGDLSGKTQCPIDLNPKHFIKCGEPKGLLQEFPDAFHFGLGPSAKYVWRSESVGQIPATAIDVLSSHLIGPDDKEPALRFINFCETVNSDDKAIEKRLEDHRQNLSVETIQMLSKGMDEKDSNLSVRMVKKLKAYVSAVKDNKNLYEAPSQGQTAILEACDKKVDTMEALREVKIRCQLGMNGRYFITVGKDTFECTYLVRDIGTLASDPSEPSGQIARCCCLLKSPIPCFSDFEADTVTEPAIFNITIPGPNVGRVNDVFVCGSALARDSASETETVYSATVSTKLENEISSGQVLEEKKNSISNEVRSGIEVLGDGVFQYFYEVRNIYELDSWNGEENELVFSTSDASSNVEADLKDAIPFVNHVLRASV